MMARERQPSQPPKPRQDMVVWKKPYFTDARMISVADWKRAGLASEQDPKAVAWDISNNYCVPVADLNFLTEEHFQQFIVEDPNFTVVTEA